MLETLEGAFRRILLDRGYNNYPASDELFEELVQALSDVAEARCELVREEGYDQAIIDSNWNTKEGLL